MSTWSSFLLVICHLKFENSLLFSQFADFTARLVFLLSCFHHPLHSSTNIPQVPSAHIMFRCHASMLMLTENSRRQILWEIALVDAFSHP